MEKLKRTRIKLLIATVTILVAAVGIFTSGPEASMSNIGRFTASTPVSDAASDYAAQCAICHGDDGRSQTAKGRKAHAADLTKSTVSDAKGMRMITNGSDEMPAFKKILSADQIKDVMEYTHRFRQSGQ